MRSIESKVLAELGIILGNLRVNVCYLLSSIGLIFILIEGVICGGR